MIRHELWREHYRGGMYRYSKHRTWIGAFIASLGHIARTEIRRG